MRTPPDIKVRIARKKDIKSACDIDYEAFSPYGTAEMSSIIEARWKVFPQGFVVAETGDQVIGYGTSEKWISEREPVMDEDPSKSHYPEGRIFCITAMAVRQEWRACGVGTAILDSLIQIAKNEKCRVILLETTHAQNFYLKRGFRATSEREQMNTKLSILTLGIEESK
jgi:ribosomal protein S18 acetylase RimI-like enzyme